MTSDLASLPLWLSGLLIVGLPTIVSMFGPFIVRRRVTLERLVVNNEVAGFKYAVVGVIYAVMLAFAVVVVWEKFGEGERAVVNEAGAAATLYRLADGFDPGDTQSLEHKLSEYLEIAIREDWPAMEHGHGSKVATAALDSLYAEVLRITRGYPGLYPVATEMFRQLDDITHARRIRLHLSLGTVPDVLWAVLTTGAVLTVVFTFFFGTRNLVAQVLMTAILVAMTSMGLFVIVQIDHPFTGPVKISPHALEAVLSDFNAQKVQESLDQPPNR